MRAERTAITGVVVVSERGVALIAALLIMMLMSALMIGFTTVVMSDQKYRGIDKDRARAFYGAQSGIEKLSTDLGNLFLTNVAPSASQIAALSNTPPVIPYVSFVAPSGVTAYGVTPVACGPGGLMTCPADVSTGPYAGLKALKKTYNLDAVTHTSSGGEAHLTRLVESVAIPVFQFGMFSDVDLSFFAGPDFNFGGRVHTNGNLFLDEGTNGTLTLTDKVTAVKDIIRQRLQNGVSIDVSDHKGTINMASSTGTFRPLLRTEGSLVDGLAPPVTNANWPTISLTTYNGYIRNGNKSNSPLTSTGARVLNLPLITIGGANTDLVKRPAVNEDSTNSVLFGERDFSKVSLRIMLSDLPSDITNLPTVTGQAPVRLGDEASQGVGLTNDWNTVANGGQGGPPPSNGVIFLGVGTAIPGAGGVMPPIARSPGVQTIPTTANTAAGAAIINVNVAAAAPALAPGVGSVYNMPASLRFDMYANLANANAGAPIYQTIRCQAVTPTQFQNCLQDVNAGLAAAPAGYLIKLRDGNFNVNQTYATTAAVTAGGAGVTKTYTVASTAAGFVNTFWMQSSAANQAWSVVTCNGATATDLGGVNHNTNPNPVLQFTGCSGTPASNLAASGITTNALVSQNVGTIGGYIKVEIQRADLSWQDVTMEILNWGFGAPNQAGTICADPTPNAIIRLQRLRDNANNCHYAGSTNSYDYWPNTLFDTREGLLRDTAPATVDDTLGGVMHFVALDIANLKKWLAGTAPYGAGSGVNALNNNGYAVYFSDRRNNRDLNNLETGEYGFEDVVNPTGAPGALDVGEDVNGNNTLDIYGQFPNFLGARNALPPTNAAVPAAWKVAGNIRPSTFLGRSAAMTSRAYLFRHALKLINGGLGNVPMPGLTVVTENPIYIQGDWNANAAGFGDPHSETSVIADAVTLLSNNWTDANSFVNPYNPGNRARTNSWYRLAIIGGKGIAFPWINGEPNDFGTDGGAHNFLRYLESGAQLNYRGAIATFYYNRQATGTYKCCTTVYSPPTRVYNFDTDFLDPAKLPPLTPVFRDINALGFAQEIRPGK